MAIGTFAARGGRIYPALDRIREVSAAIATAVANVAFDRGLTRRRRPDDVHELVSSSMYEPEYVEYV